MTRGNRNEVPPNIGVEAILLENEEVGLFFFPKREPSDWSCL